MQKREINKSELVLTSDGRIYHLHLKPEELADIIFLVGDPGRVKMMSALFDRIECQVSNREFVTHTGTYRNKRISVVSTGIGTDNIDITLNELDALWNIDFDSRKEKPEKTRLKLIRIGTSGALHEDISPGKVIVSSVSGGLDNLMYYYGGYEEIIDKKMGKAFLTHMNWLDANSQPYFIPASSILLKMLVREEYFKGITLSAPGFYAPQGRSLRIPIGDEAYIPKISSFQFEGKRINNFEMEGSALYGLSALLGHDALTLCVALANRITGDFITDYQPYIQQLLEDSLQMIGGND